MALLFTRAEEPEDVTTADGHVVSYRLAPAELEAARAAILDGRPT